MDKQCRNAILEYQEEDVKQEDYTDYLNKYHQDTEYLPVVCHVEENTENIDGKQW